MEMIQRGERPPNIKVCKYLLDPLWSTLIQLEYVRSVVTLTCELVITIICNLNMWTCHNYHSYRISKHLVNLNIWYHPTGIIKNEILSFWLVSSTRLPRSQIISLYSCFLYMIDIFLLLLLQDINDMPPDPNRPIPKPRMAPRPKVRTKQLYLINYVFILLVQTKDCMIQHFGNVQFYIWVDSYK